MVSQMENKTIESLFSSFIEIKWIEDLNAECKTMLL